jgi:S1-C subfamily serine protease
MAGLSFVPLTGELAQVLNLTQPAGLLLPQSASGSASADAGLRAGSTPAVISDANLMLGAVIL